MNTLLIHWFKLMGSRAIVLYVGCLFLIGLFLNFEQLKNNAIGQTMSRFVPSFDYQHDLIQPLAYDPFKLHLCIAYHKRVASYFSIQKAEGLAVVGYCQELLGNFDQAMNAYQDSIAVNPNYFWSHFNLGALQFKKGNYDKAVKSLQLALQVDPKVQMLLLSRSKVYSDIRRSSAEFDTYNFIKAIYQGRLEAYIIMMESLVRLERYKELFEVASIGTKESLGEEDVFYYYAGRSALSLKAYEQAMMFLEQAVRLNPNNFEALSSLSLCMRAANKENVAQALLDKARLVKQQQGSAIDKHLNVKPRLF